MSEEGRVNKVFCLLRADEEAIDSGRRNAAQNVNNPVP